MTRHVALLTLLCAAPAVALAQGRPVETTGRVTTGAQAVDNSSNSSRFTEYRDLHDSSNAFLLLDARVGVLGARGMFLDAAGTNVGRRDQSLRVAGGAAGLWRLDVAWNELPHFFSNRAQSPYTASSPGVLDVTQTAPVTFKRLATAAADAPSVVAMDTVVSNYAAAMSNPIDLASQTNTGTVALRYRGINGLDLGADYTRQSRSGSRQSYGPIGDRPPRTLNIMLAEPIDTRTNDVRLAAEYDGGRYQARAEYLISSFQNEIDVLQWRNVYANPASAGATFDTWDRLIGVYGRRPLSPDNSFRNATLSAAVTLPRQSRLAVSAAFGKLEQDAALVPYAYHNDTLANRTLPRSTAEASMSTTSLNVLYSIVPARRVSLRAFYRSFDLDNETPAAQWQYATQDASNTNGAVSYKNKRINVPYAYLRRTAGVDGTWQLGWWRSTLGLGVEREAIDREHREAWTTENTFRASWRARPSDLVSLRAKVLRGDRTGGPYDWQVTRQTYWYAAADAGTDNDNPLFSFNDHPDMRRYDVSDRARDHFEFTLTFTPRGAFTVSTSLRARRDDYTSDVDSVQPLRGQSVADSLAFTPGDQLGLLRTTRTQLTIDLGYAPTERVTLNGSFGWDKGRSEQRGLEFNENNKRNPSAVATAELGPWTRAGSQWNAQFDDATTYGTLGATVALVPNRVSLAANYTLTRGTIDLAYSGFGVTSFDGTTPFASNHQFAFPADPGQVQHKSSILNVNVEFPVMTKLRMLVGYTYDSYSISDWQQAAATTQMEPVTTELYLRDTSRSHQWGNRLFNFGSYLAPNYTGHLAYATVTYAF